MKNLLTQDQFSQWENSLAETSRLESMINDRIEYVLSIWFEAFGGKVINWYFNDASEGSLGDLSKNMYPSAIVSIYVDCNPEPKPNDNNSMVILNKFGHEYGWESEIPRRWLFEDCEEEIKQGKILFDQKLIQKKANAAVKKSLQKKLDAALAEQAKAKLSKEELKALKKVL